MAVAMAVRARVQACFDNEAELKAESKLATTPDEMSVIYIGAGWG
jgi:hypothetical protein